MGTGIRQLSLLFMVTASLSAHVKVRPLVAVDTLTINDTAAGAKATTGYESVSLDMAHWTCADASKIKASSETHRLPW